jgi:hypothetical protein
LKIVRMKRGAETPPATMPFMQVRLVLEGEVSYDGDKYGPVSCMFFPEDAAYAPSTALTDAMLLVMQLASPGKQKTLPFCSL